MERDNALKELYLEELKLSLEKIERNSGTFERYEAVMEEMRKKFRFLVDPDFVMNEVEPEELSMMDKIIEYDRLHP